MTTTTFTETNEQYKLEVKKPPFFILLLLICFGSVGAVLFTPALPAIGKFFNTSASLTQLTITTYLIGYALGQLLYGPLANGYGRKYALKIGISLEIIGAALCAIAAPLHLFTLLIFARLIMALGACVGLTLTFTIINDCYFPQQARKLISYITLAFAIVPGISTAIGGFLTTYFNWQSCFYFLTAYGIFLLLIIRWLPETAKTNPDSMNTIQIARNYLGLFSDQKLLTYSFLIGCSSAMVYLFAACAPFIVIHSLGLSPEQYGTLNLIPSIGLIIGSIASGKLSKYINAKKSISIGISIIALGSLSMLIAFAFHYIAIWTLFLLITIIYCGLPLVFSNASATATIHLNDTSGASAVMSFINMGMAVFATMLLEALAINTAIILPILLVILTLCMSWLYYKLTA